MRLMLKHIILFIFIGNFVISFKVSAQSNCFSRITEGEKLYENGSFELAIQTLDSVLIQCSFSKKEKELILVLLIKAQLEADKLEAANERIKELLNINPNYKLNKELVTESFIKYFNKFQVEPFLSAGVKIGFNKPFSNVTKTYTVFESIDYSADYEMSSAFSLMLFGEVEAFSKIALVTELNYSKYSYKRTLSGPEGFELNYSENITYFEIPVRIKKYFKYKNVRLYPFVGAYYTRLTTASAKLNLNYSFFDKVAREPDSGDLLALDIDRLNERNVNNYGFSFGVGVSKKINNFIFGVESRYALGQLNVMSIKNKYNNSDLIYNFYYVDNDVKINKIEFSFSMAYVFKHSIKKNNR